MRRQGTTRDTGSRRAASVTKGRHLAKQHHVPRRRSEFRPADGWLTFSHRRSGPVWLVIEPYGLGCQMPPGEQFHVYVAPDGAHPPSVEVTDDLIRVFSGDAIYRDGVEVLDFTPGPAGPESQGHQ